MQNVTECSVFSFRFPPLQLFEEVHTFTLLLTNGVLPHKSFLVAKGHLDSLDGGGYTLKTSQILQLTS